MREIVRGTQFKRDVKLAGKRGKGMTKVREVIVLLGKAGLWRRITRIML